MNHLRDEVSHGVGTLHRTNLAERPTDAGEGLCGAGEACRLDLRHAPECRRMMTFARQADIAAAIFVLDGTVTEIRRAFNAIIG